MRVENANVRVDGKLHTTNTQVFHQATGFINLMTLRTFVKQMSRNNMRRVEIGESLTHAFAKIDRYRNNPNIELMFTDFVRISYPQASTEERAFLVSSALQWHMLTSGASGPATDMVDAVQVIDLGVGTESASSPNSLSDPKPQAPGKAPEPRESSGMSEVLALTARKGSQIHPVVVMASRIFTALEKRSPNAKVPVDGLVDSMVASTPGFEKPAIIRHLQSRT